MNMMMYIQPTGEPRMTSGIVNSMNKPLIMANQINVMPVKKSLNAVTDTISGNNVSV